MNDTVNKTLTALLFLSTYVYFCFWKISSDETSQRLLNKKLAKSVAPLKWRRLYRSKAVLLTNALLKQDCEVCFFNEILL